MVAARAMKTACVVAACAMLLASGCAGPGRTLRGDPEAGVVLKYRVPDEIPLRYRLTSTLGQELGIPERPTQMETVQRTLVSVTPEKGAGRDLRLTVAIDSVDVHIDTSGRQYAADVSEVIGRSFSMGLSPLGEEKDFPPPDEIQYTMGEAGSRSAITTLQMMFPNLAEGPLSIGDTWVTTDGIAEEAEGGRVEITITSENTLEGFETVDGLECARIAATFTGTTNGAGTQGPAEWTSEGTMQGTTVLHFAYGEGVFVREVTKGTGTSTISAVGPDGETMEIPVTQTMHFETELVR